jgi:uncharacterized protein (DUF1697 family)
VGSFVALLRAVNVGGTGKLPMSEFKAICEELGFTSVRTYIASGNVAFASRKSETAIKRDLEKALAAHAGKAVGVMVRCSAEMAQISADNPFPNLAPNRSMAIFLDDAPPKDTLAAVRGQKDEKIKLGKREIYVHYGEGIGTSKLVIPAAKSGTARNMNTVAVLARMSAEI